MIRPKITRQTYEKFWNNIALLDVFFFFSSNTLELIVLDKNLETEDPSNWRNLSAISTVEWNKTFVSISNDLVTNKKD